MGEGRAEGRVHRANPMLVAEASTVPKPGVVIDFTILNSVPLPSGAISWWPAGGNALDAITNHNNGNLSNGVAFAAGKVGRAFALTNSYIKVSDAPSLNPTNGLTVEAWIYLNTRNSGDNDMILRKDGECGSRQYMLAASVSGKFRAHVGTTNGVYNYMDGTTSVAAQTWYHVAMTYSVASSNLSLYVNGALEASSSVSGAIITTTQPVFIGGYPGPCSAYYLPGLIDEPTIYNRALSATEISGIYTAGAAGKSNPNCVAPSTNAIGWWAGDGNNYDLAHINFATTNNGATYAAGVVGQAFSFDGVNDYVKITNAPDLNPTNALTIEAWIYLNQYTYNHSIIRKDGECANRQFLLTVGPNHKFRAHVGSTNGTYYWTDGATTVNAQTWYHVAMTFNSATSNLTLYVNGAVDATATPIGPTITTTEPIYLGGDPYPGCSQYYFGGLIDEATLYNRALSASEISAIYSAGCAGKCKIDADADGLPDDWEMRYFGNLSQSGSGDYDGDGLTNLQEYLLGTNPIQGPSFSPGAIQIHSPWD